MVLGVLSKCPPPSTTGSSGLIKCWLWSHLPHMPLGACSTPTPAPGVFFPQALPIASPLPWRLPKTASPSTLGPSQ